jgi:hypothetical protein
MDYNLGNTLSKLGGDLKLRIWQIRVQTSADLTYLTSTSPISIF